MMARLVDAVCDDIHNLGKERTEKKEFYILLLQILPGH